MNEADTSAWVRCLENPNARRIAHEWIDTYPDNSESDHKLKLAINSDPEEGFLHILAIVRLITNEQVMSYFSAGPLEDFLGKHGPQFIDRLHAIGIQHRRLRVFLGGVWEGSIRKEVWRRVEALAERRPQLARWDFDISKPE
jgi:hypothetical protein